MRFKILTRLALLIVVVGVVSFGLTKIHASTPKHTPQTFQVEIGPNDVTRIFYRLLITEYKAYKNNTEGNDHGITIDRQLRAKLRQAVDHHFGQPGGPQPGDTIELYIPGSGPEDPPVHLKYPKMEIVADDHS